MNVIAKAIGLAMLSVAFSEPAAAATEYDPEKHAGAVRGHNFGECRRKIWAEMQKEEATRGSSDAIRTAPLADSGHKLLACFTSGARPGDRPILSMELPELKEVGPTGMTPSIQQP